MPGVRVEFIGHEWDRFDELLDLDYEILYGPYGVARDGDWYHPANGSEFAVALDETDEALLGSARLLPAPGDASRQVRQVAVAPHARERGIGRVLMCSLEEVALREGASELWLNSRASAYGFYERLGFLGEGEEFVSALTGILHRTMRKRLS